MVECGFGSEVQKASREIQNQKRHSLRGINTDLCHLHFSWKDKEATN